MPNGECVPCNCNQNWKEDVEGNWTLPEVYFWIIGIILDAPNDQILVIFVIQDAPNDPILVIGIIQDAPNDQVLVICNIKNRPDQEWSQ